MADISILGDIVWFNGRRVARLSPEVTGYHIEEFRAFLLDGEDPGVEVDKPSKDYGDIIRKKFGEKFEQIKTEHTKTGNLLTIAEVHEWLNDLEETLIEEIVNDDE